MNPHKAGRIHRSVHLDPGLCCAVNLSVLAIGRYLQRDTSTVHDFPHIELVLGVNLDAVVICVMGIAVAGAQNRILTQRNLGQQMIHCQRHALTAGNCRHSNARPFGGCQGDLIQCFNLHILITSNQALAADADLRCLVISLAITTHSCLCQAVRVGIQGGGSRLFTDGLGMGIGI